MSIKIVLILTGLSLSAFNAVNAQDNYYYHENQRVSLTPVPKIARSIEGDDSVDYYLTEQGHQVGIYHKILLKIHKDTDLLMLLAPYDVTVEEQLSPQLYLIVVPSNNLAIDLSNRLSESPEVEYAHPDFIKSRVVR